MIVHLFHQTSPDRADEGLSGASVRDVVRAEIPVRDGFKTIILDAEDEFVVMIEHPNGDREAVWTMIKDGPLAGIAYADAPIDGEAASPDKELAARAWNEALELAHESASRDNGIPAANAPDSYFNEWWEHEVANPPETWDSHHD